MFEDAELWAMDDLWPRDAGEGLTAWSVPPDFRRRLHSICALYAHARPERRAAVLDHLESLALETAAALAESLLESGWRPRDKSA